MHWLMAQVGTRGRQADEPLGKAGRRCATRPVLSSEAAPVRARSCPARALARRWRPSGARAWTSARWQSEWRGPRRRCPPSVPRPPTRCPREAPGGGRVRAGRRVMAGQPVAHMAAARSPRRGQWCCWAVGRGWLCVLLVGSRVGSAVAAEGQGTASWGRGVRGSTHVWACIDAQARSPGSCWRRAWRWRRRWITRRSSPRPPPSPATCRCTRCGTTFPAALTTPRHWVGWLGATGGSALLHTAWLAGVARGRMAAAVRRAGPDRSHGTRRHALGRLMWVVRAAPAPDRPLRWPLRTHRTALATAYSTTRRWRGTGAAAPRSTWCPPSGRRTCTRCAAARSTRPGPGAPACAAPFLLPWGSSRAFVAAALPCPTCASSASEVALPSRLVSTHALRGTGGGGRSGGSRGARPCGGPLRGDQGVRRRGPAAGQADRHDLRLRRHAHRRARADREAPGGARLEQRQGAAQGAAAGHTAAARTATRAATAGDERVRHVHSGWRAAPQVGPAPPGCVVC
jgi:hypothetical protein